MCSQMTWVVCNDGQCSFIPGETSAANVCALMTWDPWPEDAIEEQSINGC